MTPQILVVDDTPDNLRLLSQMLTEQGYQTRPVTNGEKALSVAKNKRPDLILLDIMMPGMDGYEVCEQLKADERTRDIPVIFISSLNEIFDKVKAFELGGVDYITKPFHDEEVLARVKTQLTLRRQQQALEEERNRFQTLADASFEGILIHAEGEILESNHTLRKMLGYDDAGDLIGKPVAACLETPASALDELHSKSETEHPHETHAIQHDGSLFPVEIRTRAISWQERTVRVTTVRDMSVQHLLTQEERTFKMELEGREHFGQLVGKSPDMRRVYESILRISATDMPVMIYGETGSGKEVAARTIFEMSSHHTACFVPVNCASIPENLFESEFFGHRKGAFTGADRSHRGYFEQAQGGTLFLDEVGELPLAMQAKLLRVLEDRCYTPVGGRATLTADIRIIAATNKELRTLVQQRKVRSDFFHRLHILAIELPPLRQRKEDIPLLVAHVLQRQDESGNPSRLSALPPDLIERFMAYDWPGNVRELVNEVQRYLVTGAVELSGVFPDDSGPDAPVSGIPDDLPLNEAVERFEQYYIPRTIQRHAGHKGYAADTLHIDRKTLYRKLKKLGLV